MRSTSRLAAIGLFLAAATALGGDLEDARALQAQGKFQEALPKFEAAAKADPKDAAAALGLSQVLAGLGRYEEAAKAVDAARAANPANVALLCAKSRAYLLLVSAEQQADEPDDAKVAAYTDDAAKWANAALDVDSNSPEALVLRARIHKLQGNDDQVLALLDRAVAAAPKDFDANFDLGTYWFDRSRTDQQNPDVWPNAAKAFSAALAADPKSGLAALNLAHCKAWQKVAAKDVAAAYLRAAELLPDDDKALKGAYTYTPAAERVATFERLATALPKNTWRRIYHAYALLEAKQFDKAADVLEAASKVDPQNPLIPRYEGEVALAAGKDEDAVSFLVECLSLAKEKGGIDDRVFGYVEGTVGYMSRTLTAAQREKIWTACWKFFPERWQAANDAGLWYRDVGKDYKASIEWYLRAAQVATDDAAVQNDTGLIYTDPHYLNEPEKGEPFLRRAIAIGEEKGYHWNASNDPDRGYRDALNNYGKVLEGQKRWDDLKKFVEEHVPEAHPMHDVWLKEAEKK